MIVFFSAFTYLCYYLGILQLVIKKIAWLLQVTMGTSPAESVNAAGNIFIGQVLVISVILASGINDFIPSYGNLVKIHKANFLLVFSVFYTISYPIHHSAGIYLFKVNNKDTRTTPVARFGVFIINFEHISNLVSLSSVSIHPSQLTGSFDFFFLAGFHFLVSCLEFASQKASSLFNYRQKPRY